MSVGPPDRTRQPRRSASARLAVALGVGLIAWAVSVNLDERGAPPILVEPLPGATEPAPQALASAAVSTEEPAEVDVDPASLWVFEAEVVGTVDAPLFHVLERRAAPNHRVLTVDPATGDLETHYPIPDTGIVYAIATNPLDGTLALAVTDDYNANANTIAVVDDSGALDALFDETTGVFHTDLTWSADGTELLATRVDRRTDPETLSVIRIDPTSGDVTTLAEGAIDPAANADTIVWLPLHDEGARRTVAVHDRATGTIETREFGDGTADLDHLFLTPEREIIVAVLEPVDDPLLSIGDEADAHGDHNRPSTWWRLDLTTGDATQLTDTAALAHDAGLLPTGQIAVADARGISILEPTGSATAIVTSRSMRAIG